MKILKIIKKKNNLYNILLSDNTSLSFYDETIINFNLLSNKEITPENLIKITEYNRKIEAYYKALSFIKTKLRTEKELIEKLNKLGYNQNCIKEVIEKLKKQRYLNEDLYIKSYIEYQITLSIKGPLKIKKELEKIGFKEEKINNYLNQYPEDLWQEKIKKIIAKKIKANHNLSKTLFINKVKSDLYQYGYEKSLINQINIDYSDEHNILNNVFQKELKKLKRKYTGKELKEKLKYNLYKKGFNLDDINNLVNQEYL